MADEETPAEQLERLNREFIEEHDDARAPGEVKETYGHPFHDKVAEYIANNKTKLEASFMEGFHARQREQALSYLRSMGIIGPNTHPDRVNEFLAAWGIPPVPGTESTTTEVSGGSYARPSMGPATGPAASPSLDDEVIEAEIVDDG